MKTFLYDIDFLKKLLYNRHINILYTKNVFFASASEV